MNLIIDGSGWKKKAYTLDQYTHERGKRTNERERRIVDRISLFFFLPSSPSNSNINRE